MTRRHVVVAGVSARAAAESAALAGYTITAIDAFGDLDQHAGVHSISLGPGFSPGAAARAAADVSCDALVYLANFENHPKAVAALEAGGKLWGNPADVVRRVRQPALVAEALRNRGFKVPEVLLRTPDLAAGRWLVKPLSSGGGQRIHPWTPAQPIPPHCYLQQLIEGVVGSVVFVAARGRAVLLGVSHQLVGDRSFGAEGFQYCGNILAPAGDSTLWAPDETLLREAGCLADAITDEFHLVGVNGFDFVAREGALFVVEVNPRWCASMELAERAYGTSVFGAHAAACATATLPTFELAHARRGAGAVGKAVVYARRDTTVGDTRIWLDDPLHIRDVPHPREQISSGRPICTVFATEPDAASCRRALVKRAERVSEQLGAWRKERT